MIQAYAGINAYLLKTELKKTISEFVDAHGDLALERLDGTDATYQQILGAIESLPFLATRKMVVVDDLSINKEASEALEQLIERAGDTTDLVIIESKVDKRGSYYKQLKKLANLSEYNEPDESQLVSWLQTEANAQDGALSRSDASYLVQRVGINQMKLANELQKLIQYNPSVTRQTIDLLTDENPSSTIFNLIDSVFSGNLGQALVMYDDQRKQRVEPQAIHGMLVWQMHAVAIAVSTPKDVPPTQVAKESGISPYVFQKSQRIAQRMGRTKVIQFMELLRDIDYRGKHQAFDYDEALRYAIITLAH